MKRMVYLITSPLLMLVGQAVIMTWPHLTTVTLGQRWNIERIYSVSVVLSRYVSMRLRHSSPGRSLFDMLLNFTGVYFLQFTIFYHQTSQFYSIFFQWEIGQFRFNVYLFFLPCTAFQVCHLKLKQGSLTIKAAVTKYRIEILRNAGVSEKVSWLSNNKLQTMANVCIG